jgi:hypothetical protein
VSAADAAVNLVWGVALLVFLLIAWASARKRRRGALTPGPAAAGAIYDLLNQDKRNAIEMIVEEKARDPEDAEGNLPELQNPKPLTR